MTFDVIVVGSGFGGAITALRLAEAGRRVLILERGRRWAPAEFPRDTRDVGRVFWHLDGGEPLRGLFDLRTFSALGAVVAAGVGGGSLVYANIHIRPDADVFSAWPAPYSRAMLDPWYDTVAKMLDVSPLPPELSIPKRTWFHGIAAKLGFPCFDPDQAVAWRDPGEPQRGACVLTASCEFGCAFGAKNTLDYTYLAQAEARGGQIATGINARHVERTGDGYTVVADDLATGTQVRFTAPRVVLSAGTLGTNEILLRSRDVAHSLPDLSEWLGRGFSANGDFLGTLQGVDTPIDGWNGPDVTTVMRCAEAGQHFTLAAPTFNAPTYAFLARLGVAPSLPHLPLGFAHLAGVIRAGFRAGAFNKPWVVALPGAGDPSRLTNLFAIGRDNANGRLHLVDDRLDIAWDFAKENAELVAAMDRVMHRIAEASGGRYAPIPTWTVFRRPLTVHPLGGCRLSTSRDAGVVSARGEVHGYPGLFVADGSVLPTAIGFHPAMTISAVSEVIAAGLAAG